MPLDPGPTVVNAIALNHNGTLCVAGARDGMVRIILYAINRWHGPYIRRTIRVHY
jgi:hypothetical protein